MRPPFINRGVRLLLTVFSEVLSRFSVFFDVLLLFWVVTICVDDAVHDGVRVAAGYDAG